MTLLDLSLGESSSVLKLDAEGADRRRLMDLGFIPGSRVEALRRSPLGDPVAYRIRGAVIALRRADAGRIHIDG
ncbi:MAG TPA: FeoA family protein [candidate division Zixibacteria bacterium]|jgi:ferrous iron transport protein A